MIAAAFDSIARDYDAVWTRSAGGRAQRAAVWQVFDTLFQPGEHILDLGCGTGEDAVHLMSSGLKVTAIDASPQMVGIASRRGVDAHVRDIEDIGQLGSVFDGAVSNFGALNCVAHPGRVAKALAAMIAPGGYVAVCMMGRCCFWETAYYLLHGRFRRAVRRWWGRAGSTIGVTVFYPSVRSMARFFRPEFRLVSWRGVGVFVPPSYVRGLSGLPIGRLSGLDQRVSHLPFFRAMADHRLLIFKRN